MTRILKSKAPAKSAPKQDDPLWRSDVLQALMVLCASPEEVRIKARLDVVARLAMADARRYHQAERLSADQVMNWPTPLFKEYVRPDLLAEALRKHRNQYHIELMTETAVAAATALADKRLHWQAIIQQRATEAKVSRSGYALAAWATKQPSLIFELSQAGMLPPKREAA
jgi:hypothetical protein